MDARRSAFLLYIQLQRLLQMQSVWRLATEWTIRPSNPDESEIFLTRPDRPHDPRSIL